MNEKLRAAREKLKLTQRQVAEKVGIVEQLYQKYEYGTIPGAYTACKIAEILNTTVEALYSPSKPSIVQDE